MLRKKYSSSYKVRTVLEGLKLPEGIAAYCRQRGISEVQFYHWQKQMITNADALFTKLPKTTERKINNLEEELRRKDHIIAVVTEEALELKKKLTD